MRNIRKYAQQTSTRLIIGGLAIIFLIGEGLIYLLYGKNAALMGMLCLGMGLVPVFIILCILWLMEQIVRKNTFSK